MGLVTIIINVDSKEIVKEIKIAINQLKQEIMGTFADLQAEFDSFKTVIADERAQATAKLAELQASIDALTAGIAGGGTPAQIDALIADIQAAKTAVSAIIPDAPPPAAATSSF